MSKSKISTIIFLLVIAGIATGVLFVYKPVKQLSLSPTAKTTTQEIGIKSDKVYKDESGFSFKYPEDLIIKDVTPEDNSYYSVLSLKKEGKELKISMQDTTYKTPDKWLEKEVVSPEGVSVVGATSLGGLSAKQYSDGEKLWTVAIDQGILYSIVGPKDGRFWEKLHDLVVSTLAFSKPEQPAGGTGSGGGAIYEEDEVVE